MTCGAFCTVNRHALLLQHRFQLCRGLEENTGNARPFSGLDAVTVELERAIVVLCVRDDVSTVFQAGAGAVAVGLSPRFAGVANGNVHIAVTVAVPPVASPS